MHNQPSADSPTTNGHTSTPKSILAISLAKHLHGHDIASYIQKDWNLKATPSQQQRFDNQGFNLDPTTPEHTLKALEHRLQERRWDGVLFGWCVRGSSKEFTVLFERVVGTVVEEVVRRQKLGLDGREGGLKLMFNEGPEDLVRPVLRGFGGEEE